MEFQCYQILLIVEQMVGSEGEVAGVVAVDSDVSDVGVTGDDGGSVIAGAGNTSVIGPGADSVDATGGNVAGVGIVTADDPTTGNGVVLHQFQKL